MNDGYYGDIIYIWWLVLDIINIGGGRDGLIGAIAAPDAVAAIIIFVYERGAGGVVIMDIYDWCLFIMI